MNTNTTQVPKVAANELVEDVEMPELTEQEPEDVEEVSTSEPSQVSTTDNELQFDTLIPFQNHPDGMASFSENCTSYLSETPLEHFVTALKAVMEDNTLPKKQTDPIDIIKAYEEWEEVRPTIFQSRMDLSQEERSRKDNVDRKFITYMSTLRSTNVISIPVRVFCHMTSKDGCPAGFKNYNDRTFKKQNMDDVMNILDGKSDKPWNNIHNASMHMMLPWSNEQLKTHIAAEMEIENSKWNLRTPKEIGSMLEVWFTSLDNENLKNRKDLEGVLVPKAGQHRSAAIPRWVRRKDVTTATWQGVFGTSFQMNFWLLEEQPVCKYLSGCIQDLDSTTRTIQWSDQACRFADNTSVEWFQAKWRSQNEWSSKETKE